MERPIVALDTERPASRGAPHLLELAAVRVVDGEIVDQFSTLVCPSIPIEADTTAVHGIVEDDVRDAPTVERVLNDFSAWVGDDWMVAHRSETDAELLAFEYLRNDLEPPPGLFLDTLSLSRRYIPDSPDHKLRTLAEHLDLEEFDAHRALPDAVTCWKILEECLEQAGGLESTDLSLLLSQSGGPTTVTSMAPRTPRLKPRLRGLSRAIEQSEDVRIQYGDGTGPPAQLPVLPRFIYRRSGKGYLEAECLQSGLLKTYLIDRIQKLL
ncbi:MAG: DNA polymerase III epsilon subunit-like protein [Chlamydiales bacterium]|jgi:DNA polymerase III epsilon subunit-like protein